jgi:hypothetical protein
MLFKIKMILLFIASFSFGFEQEISDSILTESINVRDHIAVDTFFLVSDSIVKISGSIDLAKLNAPAPAPTGFSRIYNVLDHGGLSLLMVMDETGFYKQIADGSFIAHNSTASTIPKGTPCYRTGTIGNTFRVAPAIANDSLKSVVIGFTMKDVTAGSFGRIQRDGTLYSQDIASLDSGSIIFLSSTTAGGLTNIKPSYPNYIVYLGYILSNKGLGNSSMGIAINYPTRDYADSCRASYKTTLWGTHPVPAEGMNNQVLTTDGAGTWSFSDKTGGTAGTITSINGSSEALQTILGDNGLTVVDSGTGNFVHKIRPASGYIIPPGANDSIGIRIIHLSGLPSGGVSDSCLILKDGVPTIISASTYRVMIGAASTVQLSDSMDKCQDTINKYKDHSYLNNLNSTNYTHLTAVNHTDLTDAGYTVLHKHLFADSSGKTNMADSIKKSLAISKITGLQDSLNKKLNNTSDTMSGTLTADSINSRSLSIGKGNTKSKIIIAGEYQASVFSDTNFLEFKHGGSSRFRWISKQWGPSSDNFDMVLQSLNSGANGYNNKMIIMGATNLIGIGDTLVDSTLTVSGSGHFTTNLKVDGNLYSAGNATSVQSQLNAKEPAISTGTASQFYSWNKTWRSILVSYVAGLTDSLAAKLPLHGKADSSQYSVTAKDHRHIQDSVVRLNDRIATDTIKVDTMYVRAIKAVGKLIIGSNYLSYDGAASRGLCFDAFNKTFVKATALINGNNRYVLSLYDDNAMTAGVGAGLDFRCNDGVTAERTIAGINAYKANATSGNYSGQLHFQTRLNGFTPTTHMIIDEYGKIGINNTAPDSTFTVTGSGHYTTNLKVDGNIYSAGNAVSVQNQLNSKEPAITGTANYIMKYQSDGSGHTASIISESGTVANVAGQIKSSASADQIQIQSYTSTGKTWRIGTDIGSSGHNRNLTIWESDAGNVLYINQSTGDVTIPACLTVDKRIYTDTIMQHVERGVLNIGRGSIGSSGSVIINQGTGDDIWIGSGLWSDSVNMSNSINLTGGINFHYGTAGCQLDYAPGKTGLFNTGAAADGVGFGTYDGGGIWAYSSFAGPGMARMVIVEDTLSAPFVRDLGIHDEIPCTLFTATGVPLIVTTATRCIIGLRVSIQIPQMITNTYAATGLLIHFNPAHIPQCSKQYVSWSVTLMKEGAAHGGGILYRYGDTSGAFQLLDRDGNYIYATGSGDGIYCQEINYTKQ